MRTKPLGAFGAVLLLALIFTAVFADVLAPYDPYKIHQGHSLVAPSPQFLMGTDEISRDILSRVIYGARISLWVGIVAVGLGTTSGSLLGILSGYVGGKFDFAVQRLVDMIMSLPTIVMALAIMAALGQSITNVMIAIAIVISPSACRVIRGTVLAVKEHQYIDAARAIGCGDLQLMLRHVLPNVAAPIIILATTSLGGAILSEASLSFLGLGTPPPTPSWGGMLTSTGRSYFEVSPWVAVFPGLAISLAIYGFNLLGDALRDVWDPRLRGR
ncbi:MAG: ABC transporter permease [Chloroflexi bacterium]|nr:ABC transporter permease [Chloroflexota bacterium]